MGTECILKKAVVEYFVSFKKKKVKEWIELLCKKSQKNKDEKENTQSKSKHPEDKHLKQRKAEKENYKNEELLNT